VIINNFRDPEWIINILISQWYQPDWCSGNASGPNTGGGVFKSTIHQIFASIFIRNWSFIFYIFYFSDSYFSFYCFNCSIFTFLFGKCPFNWCVNYVILYFSFCNFYIEFLYFIFFIVFGILIYDEPDQCYTIDLIIFFDIPSFYIQLIKVNMIFLYSILICFYIVEYTRYR
jgi:hypothetical protein